MNDFLKEVYWNNTVENYLWVLGGIIAAWILMMVIKGPFIKLLCRIAKLSRTSYDDAIVSGIEKFILPYLFVIAVYSLLNILNLHPRLEKGFNILLAIISTYYIVRFVIHAMHKSVVFYMEYKGEPAHRITQITGVLLIFKAVIWIIGILLLIENLGYSVTSVVTGLGIGGIAIALAAQNILGDLFSYFVIFFDKPFEVGDSINVNDKGGTVEKIGIKTTHIRTLAGEQLVMPNAELVKSPIQNFKRQNERRVSFRVSVWRNTSMDFLKEFPETLKQLVLQHQQTRFDRAHLAAITDNSFDFELVYFITTPDYGLFMNTQQDIYLSLIDILRKNDIQFSDPVNTFVFNNTDVAPAENAGKK